MAIVKCPSPTPTATKASRNACTSVDSARTSSASSSQASVVLRDLNVGYQDQPGMVPFGPDQLAPENGFRVCQDCGIAVMPGDSPDDAVHRRSCSARRRQGAALQKGNQAHPFKWESVYLYRELRSEAIRLLLPVADDQDIDTLSACLHLGLRLRFEGNPAHLIVTPQIMPDLNTTS
jgi:DEAD/DEAH box helicase domain-containing protein